MGEAERPRIPQADRLDVVRGLVAVIAASPDSWREDTTTTLGLAPRHVDYYRQAAELLGLLARSGRLLLLTDDARELLTTPPASAQQARVFISCIRRAVELRGIREYLLGDENLSENELNARVQEMSGLSPSTARRRAGCMYRWRCYLERFGSRDPVSVTSRPAAPQLGLFEPRPEWPEQARFPRNDAPAPRVGDLVRHDLAREDDILVITGYSSLEYLIGFLGGPARNHELVRIAFGVEPFQAERATKALAESSVPEEMRDHWLRQGISILQSPALLHVVKMIDQGRIVARISPSHSRRIHAKLFANDHAVTLGSSNFSTSGMERLNEANVRFRPTETRRFEEARHLGEAFWQTAVEFTDELRGLLRSLLQGATWKEALARAAAELLEGSWAQLPSSQFADSLARLWPSQRQGIAQALWILDNVGSVLVADATGSGKTRMAAHLLRVLRDRLYLSGRGSGSGHGAVDPVVTAPPAVRPSWQQELYDCGLHLEVHSHGMLSHKESSDALRLIKALRRAQILAVDEAHRFLNVTRRTGLLLGTMPDHTVLFTATPVNRGPSDLLGIINLLGADNLDEAGLEVVRRNWGPRARLDQISTEQAAELRREVQRFTVRRTKRMLNALVDREPDVYRNALGQPCRFPAQRTRTYPLRETERDRQTAREIREIAKGLRGLVNLVSPIDLPQHLVERFEPQDYVMTRLRGAAGLSAYQVMASLRSSRAALLEHLLGTEEAKRRVGIRRRVKPHETGHMIRKLRGLDAPPRRRPLEPHLPEFLRNESAFLAARDEEITRYEKIAALASQISDARLSARVDVLQRALGHHELVLAFDTRPLSLAMIATRLKARGERFILATGVSNTTEKKKLHESFRLGATTSRLIALCSDAMSEGLNLQAGSVVVHLDMPSVIRVAEQRIGRIDRMDSGHELIEIWWPTDSPEFKLEQDRRFARRHEFVARVLGANIELPEELGGQVVDPKTIMRETDASTEFEIDDAFAPVRSLVEGIDAIVPESTYAAIRSSQATVISAVSVVRASEPWVFVAIRATDTAAPRWALVPAPNERPITGLDEVAQALRSRLRPDTEDLELNEKAAGVLSDFVRWLEMSEPLLLAPKKRRALGEMEHVLGAYARSRSAAVPDRALVNRLLRLLGHEEDGPYASPRRIAECWLEVIRPRWHRRILDRGRRHRPVLLKDLRSSLKKEPLSTEELERGFSGLEAGRRLRERVAAAIVGVP